MNATTYLPPRSMSELYQGLPESTPVQLIGNLLVMSPAPTYRHQKLLLKLAVALNDCVENEDLGEVLVAPVDVYLGSENIFQPDILFLAKENRGIIQKNGIHGPPSLIMELLSPGTAKYDRKKKKDVYERSGVKEYWIVNPESRATEGYSLKNGHYEDIGTGKPGIILSELLDREFRF